MANASRTEVYDIAIEDLYNTIIDYHEYPDFVDGVSDIEVLDQDETSARVEYHLNLIKKFKYVLSLTQERPTKVSWELEDGDLFKSNNGSWELKDLGDNQTEVTYSLELDVKMFAPKAVVNKLVGKNLPDMMEGMVNRAKERNG
jgi:coenzyme Q-binding protein COQ10